MSSRCDAPRGRSKLDPGEHRTTYHSRHDNSFHRLFGHVDAVDDYRLRIAMIPKWDSYSRGFPYHPFKGKKGVI